MSVEEGDAVAFGPGERVVLKTGETIRRPAPQAATDGAVESTDGDNPSKPRSDAPVRDKPRSRPSDLLRRARTHRRTGDIDAAIGTYEQLIRQHPRSDAARTATVSVGQLNLERGRHKAALGAFRRYLRSGGGALGEDAAFGEIRALRALGRNTEADRATARFEQRYPTSHYGDKLRR